MLTNFFGLRSFFGEGWFGGLVEKFISIIIIIKIMETTTIAVRKEVRNMINEFGNKGETYSDILVRIVSAAKKVQIRELLMDESGCVTIDEAIKEARKKWPR